MTSINLRKVVEKDEYLLFEWRNIDELVALSKNKSKVTPYEHKKWLKNKLSESNCEMYIIQSNNYDVGLIKMELIENECEVSIYLIPGNAGKGLGYKAMLQFFKKSKIKCQFYLAKIQINNIPSQRLFKKLGFIEHFNDNVLVVYKKTKCNSK